MSRRRRIVLVVLIVILIGMVIFLFIPKEKKSDKTIFVTVNGKSFKAELYDNQAAQGFYDALPLTLDMQELNGNEKYYNLDTSLPTKSSPAGHISKGDLRLFGDNCIVLFYDSFFSGYSYTNIGHISDSEGIDEALGSGSVTVTFSVNRS